MSGVPIETLTGKASVAASVATAAFNVWEGSVSSGKTISSLLAWLDYLLPDGAEGRGPAGALLMVGRTERTLIRNVIAPLQEWLGSKAVRLLAGSGEVFVYGRRIYLAGANDERSQEKIRGLTLAGAYVDEASTVPESFWMMLLSRLRVPGARLFATSNPDSPGHWLKRSFLDRARVHIAGDGTLTVHDKEDEEYLDLHRFSFRLRDNPHLGEAYVRQLERSHQGLWRRRLIDGEWVVAEGAVYDMWDPARHVIDLIPPISRWLGVGVDYGTANPFHAVLVGAGLDSSGGRKRECLYAVSEFRWDSKKMKRQLTDAEYSQRLRAWLMSVRVPGTRLHGPVPEYVVVDPSAASFKVQLHQDGWTVADGDSSVLDGIRVVASVLGDGRLRVSRSGCPVLIDEMAGYCWDDKAAKRGEDKPVKLDDHGPDGVRYLVKTTQSVWAPLLRMPYAA